MKTTKVRFSAKEFNQLQLDELYEVLKLRSAIFVVEQNCAYQDIDGRDQTALHILGKMKGEIVAYARCFEPGTYFEQAAIGRVLVKENCRNQGMAHQLLDYAVRTLQNFYRTDVIKLSAQQYLIDFYQTHGFKTTGTGYLEDGIPHIAMVRNYNKDH